jgi:hypothetical protein
LGAGEVVVDGGDDAFVVVSVDPDEGVPGATGVPGRGTSLKEPPDGTVTVTGTTCPVGSFTQTVFVSAEAGMVKAARNATATIPAESRM